MTTKSCPACDGRCYLVDHRGNKVPCADCNGTGVVDPEQRETYRLLGAWLRERDKLAQGAK